MDTWNGRLVMNALEQAGAVIACTAFRTPSLDQVATVYLPIAIYAENEGTFININGISQQFASSVPAPGEARPGWKVLRVLANHLNMENFNYENIDEITREVQDLAGDVVPDNSGPYRDPVLNQPQANTISRITDMPMNSLDVLVRHAEPLQQTDDIADDTAHLSQSMADKIGLVNGDRVVIEQSDASLEIGYSIDNRIPDNTVLIHAAGKNTSGLGAWYAGISIRKA
ncbi:MAG: molybdopterin-dependent oxidoreductase [Gammaproteobacteria bacterium]|nr:molybdopterin-dependent oxidoreductase [Gammaproteobacteria bacterium]